jgi:hypothetical protein
MMSTPTLADSSSSISRPSSSPLRSWRRSFWRVSDSFEDGSAPMSTVVVAAPKPKPLPPAPSRPPPPHALLGLRAVQLDRGVGQVADDLLDVLADVADLGETGCLHLHERRVGQRGQAARDLGLAHTGRTDQQDVLRHHFVAQAVVELHAAPAVAQRNGDCALGGLLADDVAVQFLHDLARGHGGRAGIRHKRFGIRKSGFREAGRFRLGVRFCESRVASHGSSHSSSTTTLRLV